MSDLADANLVLAALDETDALHERAIQHIRSREPLIVPFSVGIELMLIARRRNPEYVEALGGISALFVIEREAVLFAAADALDRGDASTVFDAVHAADAANRGVTLHTADQKLLRSGFPTTPF